MKYHAVASLRKNVKNVLCETCLVAERVMNETQVDVFLIDVI